MFDITTGQDLGGTFGSGTTGNQATWTIAGQAVPADNRIRLTLTGVTNPPAGNHRSPLKTSSDTVPATTPPYTTGPAHAVSSPTMTLSSSAAGATGVTYTTTFTTSATGALASSSGTITVMAPSGTAFSNGSANLFDLTTDAHLGTTSAPQLADGGATATWTVGARTRAGRP